MGGYMDSTKIYKGYIKNKMYQGLYLTNAVKWKLKVINGIDIDRGEERLLYQVQHHQTIYYSDIENGTLYTVDEVLEPVLFSKITSLPKRITKKNALKCYKEDLHQLLRIPNLYIGSTGIMEEVYRHFIHPTEMSVRFHLLSYKENRLLFKEEERYVDLENYASYAHTKIDCQGGIVFDEEPFSHVFQIQEEQLEKIKILEMYHRQF